MWDPFLTSDGVDTITYLSLKSQKLESACSQNDRVFLTNYQNNHIYTDFVLQCLMKSSALISTSFNQVYFADQHHQKQMGLKCIHKKNHRIYLHK